MCDTQLLLSSNLIQSMSAFLMKGRKSKHRSFTNYFYLKSSKLNQINVEMVSVSGNSAPSFATDKFWPN